MDSIAHARAALADIAWSDAVLHHAAQRGLAAAVDGLRADLVMLRAARALAALQGRRAVGVADVDAVAELALAHRRKENPADLPRKPASSGQEPAERQDPPSALPGGEAAGDGDWGALPPEPEAFRRVQPPGGWFPKKA